MLASVMIAQASAKVIEVTAKGMIFGAISRYMMSASLASVVRAAAMNWR